MSRARRNTAKTTADYAMSAERLDCWLRERAASAAVLRPTAWSLSMLDGFVAAIVVGPVSIAPLDWICPLLGVEPEAFNHDTEEFAAIAAAAMRFNVIGKGLVEAPDQYEPLFLRSAGGEVDARPWCEGFYAAMQLRLLAWSRLMLPHSIEHGLLLPILFHCRDDAGRPVLAHAQTSPAFTREAWRDIAPAIIAMREYWQPIRFNKSA
jgi:yecA family protein